MPNGFPSASRMGCNQLQAAPPFAANSDMVDVGLPLTQTGRAPEGKKTIDGLLRTAYTLSSFGGPFFVSVERTTMSQVSSSS